MNASEREELVDYVLGRLSPEKSAALERRALDDDVLARRARTLRQALDEAPSFSPNQPALVAALRRRCEELFNDAENGRAPEDDRAPEIDRVPDASAVDSSSSKSSGRRVVRNFDFIPKRVSAPSRNERSSFVFKRARISKERERDYKTALRRRAQIEAAFYALTRRDVSYSLVDDFPVSSLVAVVESKSRREFGAFSEGSFDFLEDERIDRVEANLPDSERFVARADLARNRAFAISASESSEWRIAPGVLDASGEFFAVHSADEGRLPETFRLVPLPLTLIAADDSSRAVYAILPIEYSQARARFVEFGKSYVFENFDSFDVAPKRPGVDVAKKSPRVDVAKKKSRDLPKAARDEYGSPFPTASPELIELISAAVGQSATILPQKESTYVASSAPDEKFEPTYSAEELRLAELLGRDLTPFDLDEYYWEDIVEEEEDESIAPKPRTGILAKLFYWATEPPVAVGRATIRVFRSFFPLDLEREEASRETRLADQTKVGGLSDMMISVFVGILVAAFVVFPILRGVIRDVFVSIVEGSVRDAGKNFSIRQSEADFNAADLMLIEQFIHPSYEATEFKDGDAAFDSPGWHSAD